MNPTRFNIIIQLLSIILFHSLGSSLASANTNSVSHYTDPQLGGNSTGYASGGYVDTFQLNLTGSQSSGQGKRTTADEAFYAEGIAAFEKGEFPLAAEKFDAAFRRNADLRLKAYAALAHTKAGEVELAREAFHQIKVQSFAELNRPGLTQAERDKALVGIYHAVKNLAVMDDPGAFSNLPKDAAGVEVGKLFENAFEGSPLIEYAYQAANNYAKGGDLTRAAAQYRKILELQIPREPAPPLPDKPGEEEYIKARNSELEAQRVIHRKLILHHAHARSWLTQNGYATQGKGTNGEVTVSFEPKYPLLCSVNSLYTKDTSRTEIAYQSKEEYNPASDVVVAAVVPAVERYYGLGAQAQGHYDFNRFKTELVKPLGTTLDFEALLLQGFAAYHARIPGVTTNVVADAVALKLLQNAAKDTNVRNAPKDLSQLPVVFPLIEQIKNSKVEYLKTDAARADYLLNFKDPKKIVHHGKPLDSKTWSTAFSGTEWGIYVMDPDGKFYAAPHKVSVFHHSSFLAGADVACAGEIQAENGVIKGISNKTGHYKTRCVHLVQTLEELKSQNVDLSTISVIVVGQVINPISNITPKFDKMTWTESGGAAQFLKKFKEDQAGFKAAWKALGFLNDPYL